MCLRLWSTSQKTPRGSLGHVFFLDFPEQGARWNVLGLQGETGLGVEQGLKAAEALEVANPLLVPHSSWWVQAAWCISRRLERPFRALILARK